MKSKTEGYHTNLLHVKAAGTPPRRSPSLKRLLNASPEPDVWTNLNRVREGPCVLSRLEELPTEILEDIFTRSLNHNLLQASPYLGYRLSSVLVQKEVLKGICSAMTPLVHRPEKAADVQSWLLSRKAFSASVMRQCLVDFMTATLVRDFFFYRLHWLHGSGPLITSGSTALIRSFIASRLEASRRDDYEGYECFKWQDTEERAVTLDLGVRQGFICLQIIERGEIGNSILPNGQAEFHCRFLNLDSACCIPEKLLHGPWTDDKCDMLEIVVRSNASVDWINSTKGEVAEAGFWEALKEGNVRAMKLLLVRSDRAVHNSWRPLYRNRGVGVITTTEHLKYAIERPSEQKVLAALLESPEINFDFRDPIFFKLYLHPIMKDEHIKRIVAEHRARFFGKRKRMSG